MQFSFGGEQTELQQKATVAISAKQAGDPRYGQLILALAGRLKISAEEAEHGIMLLVMGMPL